MKVKLKLNPGNRGTKKLQHHYSYKLPCARYRSNQAIKKRYKTIQQAGGICDTYKKLWKLNCNTINKPGFEARIREE